MSTWESGCAAVVERYFLSVKHVLMAALWIWSVTAVSFRKRMGDTRCRAAKLAALALANRRMPLAARGPHLRNVSTASDTRVIGVPVSPGFLQPFCPAPPA